MKQRSEEDAVDTVASGTYPCFVPVQSVKEGSDMVDTVVEKPDSSRGGVQADRIAPAARPLDQFCVERVNDDFVLYDTERIQYHTLNSIAYDVWRLCDGQLSARAISSELAATSSAVHVEAVALAIEELGEAGMLEETEERFNARIQRRAVLKLAAAGVVGAIGLPLVQSITAPSAEAQTSCGTANQGSVCSASNQCRSCCCCRNTVNGNQNCSNQCNGLNEVCL
jgi:hypothetical protein